REALMNTSYKIALVAAAGFCVLIIGYSLLVPGDGALPDTATEPMPRDVAERLPAGGPNRPLTMSSARDRADAPPPAAPAAAPPTASEPTPSADTAASPGDDLMAHVLRAGRAGAPSDVPASVTPEPVPSTIVESDTPVAVANQPGDVDAPSAATPVAPEPSPDTLTIGGPTRPVIPPSASAV